MELIIGILSGLVGAAIGFFAAKYFFTQSSQANKSSQEQRSQQEKLTGEALNHITHSKKLVDEIARQSQALQGQIQSYESALIQLRGTKDADSLPFFSAQATEFLRTKQQGAQLQPVDASFQPPDYTEAQTAVIQKAANGDVTNNKES